MNRKPTEHELEHAMCILHNLGADLSANRQESDLEWLAAHLFEWSNLGAGDIKTVNWLLTNEQFEYLGLTRQALLGDGPRRWDCLSHEQQEAWRKIARICFYLMPRFAERIGHRYMQSAKAIQQEWNQCRSE